MAYVTNNDIEERLGTAAYIQLTDDTGSGSADIDKVDEARLGAEGEVNSYLGRRYAVPIDLTAHAEVADVLKSFVLDLVEYRLHSRRPPVPSAVSSKRNQAIAWLDRVARADVVLPSVDPILENSATGISAETSSNERFFTRDDLDNL
ncbi:MAG: DUF1320 domain-containing protein [Planctomycetes bacterium]|nr:DUF1320 domain-containing protein [Planctomycetota bacterium]